jgi:alkylation response protein AidB-like acyl-CoA dehydrogenase
MSAVPSPTATVPSLESFRQEARQWLAGNAAPRDDARTVGGESRWGVGSDRVGLFHNLTVDEERAVVARLQEWRRRRYDAGFGPISWAAEYGGRGYPPAYELAFAEEESQFSLPDHHEAVGITMGLIAPTIREWGTEEQGQKYLRPMLRGDVIWCQLFSEPDAGSDLAGLRTRAVRDGDKWCINGQKVWTSGARHAEFGYLLARTDPDAAKHAGLTTFLVPMRDPAVEVRPLRQMSGGSSFNEVFFTDLVVSDADRLGPVNGGWRVVMTTLGFERVAGSGEGSGLMTRFDRVMQLARHVGRDRDPVVRQELARLFTHARLLDLLNERVRMALASGATPGPEGSVAKLFYGDGLALVSDVVSMLLGPRLTADTDEWGTFAWMEHVTGVPGGRIAGGTDEIQRNVIGERILGLPKEPKVER